VIRTLKMLSLLLAYPTAEIAAAAPSFAAVLDEESLLPEGRRRPLRRLAAQLAERDLYDVEERYVLLFDRTRSLSLHLFEHVHGESRDRGQAMVELKELYAANGLEMPANELPDYLPLFLEFLSTRPLGEAREYLADIVHIVSVLEERLRRRKSIYAEVFGALETLAGVKPERQDVEELLDLPDDDPHDLEALDRVWEEEPVTFGGAPGPDASASCGPDRVAAQIRAGRRPPPDVDGVGGTGQGDDPARGNQG
jgi:nitrate reductase delta subunit